MKRAITILAGCLLVTSGLARTAEPVFEFECDTPAGHFSHWSQTLEPGKVTVKGTVTISEKREHERWNPAAAALFIGNPSGTFGLQIYTLKTRKDVLLLRITKPGTRDEEPFAMRQANVTVYGSRTCPDTNRATRYLDRRAIPYEFKDVDESPEYNDYIAGLNDGKRVMPTIRVDNEILINPSEDELTRAIDASEDERA